MQGNDTFVKAVMTAVCAGHVITGLCALISGKPGIEGGSSLYGADFEPTKQFEIILRPLGAFMLALAYLQSKAIREPQRYKGVLDATLLVILLRQVQRFIHRKDITETFGIEPRRHWASTFFFLATGALVLMARTSLESDAE